MVKRKEVRHARIIAVGNQKGGVGKTTTTVHLAAGLGEIGRKCLIWDLDMNAGATSHFGIPDTHGFAGTFEVIIGEEDVRDVILSHHTADVKLPKNVDLIAARRKLEKVDQVLAAKDDALFVHWEVLKEPLETIRESYDYIFLDTAPNATSPTVAAYMAADYFLLTAIPETFAVAGMKAALKDIGSAKKHGNTKLRLLGVVISSVDGRRSRLKQELLDYVEESFSKVGPTGSKFKTLVGKSVIVPTAQKYGTTVFETEPTHKVTEHYRELSRELEDRFALIDKKSAATTSPPQRSVLSEPTEEEAVTNA